MEQNRIKPVPRTKTFDNSDKQIKNFWEIRQQNSEIYSANYENEIYGLLKNNLVGRQDEVILVYTPRLESRKLIDILANLSLQARIYILLNEINDSVKKLAGRCLIRYGVEREGSMILINPNTNLASGAVFSSDFTETSLAFGGNILLYLSKEQINKVLFNFYSYLFWNEAKYEILTRNGQAQEVSQAPFMVYKNVEDSADPDYIISNVQSINEGKISLTKLTEDFTRAFNSELILPKTSDKELIKFLAQYENKIYASDFNVLNFVLSAKSFLIPGKSLDKDKLWAIELNSGQQNYLTKKFDQLKQNANFIFHRESRLADFVEKQIEFLDTEEKVTVEPKTEMDLGTVSPEDQLPPKEEFENLQPDFPEVYALQVEYTWTVEPFYTPAGAKKHKLYERWQQQKEKINQIFTKHLQNLEQQINQLSVFQSLLGTKTKLNRLKEELRIYSKTKFEFWSKDQRNKKLKEINEFIEQVLDLLNESEIVKLEQLLQQKQEQEQQIKQQIDELQNQIDQKQFEFNKAKDEFLKQHGEKLSWNDYKSMLDRKAGKKNCQKNPKECQQAKKDRDELQKFEREYLAEIGKLKQELDDLKAKSNNLLQEIKKLEKQYYNLKHREETEQKTEQPASSLDVFVKAADNKPSDFITIPNDLEPLPAIGTLYSYNNTNYLEIEYWEQYEKAKEIAKLYNAKISAKTI